MSVKNSLYKILTVFFLLSFSVSPILAAVVSPAIHEQFISNTSDDSSEFIITNTEKKEITVKPQIYAYSPQKENLIDEDGYIFLEMDEETYSIDPSGSLTLSYRINTPDNLEPGTYFNLIVLEQINSDQVIKSSNPVNTTANLSHLVVVHVTEQGVVEGITSDFANISIEVVDNGIPFLKPMTVKYVYQNKTNYVLEPEGEIQVFNVNGKYEPMYVKINVDNEKLYPGDIMEEEISINQWHILDIFQDRKVVGRFYNGLDENYITQDTTVPAYSFYLIFGVAFLALGVFLVKSVVDDQKKS